MNGNDGTTPIDGSPEWHRQRALGLGGSDIAVIAAKPMGFHSHGSEWEVYLAKTGKLDDREDNFRMRYGRAVEYAIAKEWAKDIGATFVEEGARLEPYFDYDIVSAMSVVKGDSKIVFWKPPTLVHPGNPIIRGNPDSLATIDRKLWLVTIKTTGIENRWEWENEPPARVIVQDTYYAYILESLGFQVEGIISLCEINHDPPIEHRTKYDPKFGRALGKIASRWWRERIVEGIPPDLDGSKAADIFIESKATRAADEEVQDDEDLIAAYYDANEAAKIADYQLGVIKQKIKVKLSGADVLTGRVGAKNCKITHKADKNGKVSMRAYPPRKP